MHASTGNKLQVETDYAGPGDLPLLFTRTYNSRMPTSVGFKSRLGLNWRSTYDRLIRFTNSTVFPTAYAYRQDGRTLRFKLSGGQFLSDADVADRLVQLTDGSGNLTGWKYTIAATQEVETYDSSGALIEIKSRAGLTQSLAYSAGGELVSVTDSFGKALTLGYNGSGQLASLTDPDGQVYSYSYNGVGNVTSVTYPNSTVRTYHYNEASHTNNIHFPYAMTGITDEANSRFATYQYDQYERTTSTEHAGGTQKYTFNYTGGGTWNNYTTVTDPLLQQRVYDFSTILGRDRIVSTSQPCASCGGSAAAAISYDANGNIASRTDFKNSITTYAYDLTRNLQTSRTEASNSAKARTITTQWHATYRLPTQIDEPGKRTTFTHDPSGNVLTRTELDTGSNVSRTWSYTYNSYGKVLTANGPRTDVLDITTYSYYNCATGYECGQVHTITNAAGVTTYHIYNAHGQPLTITDPNDVVITLTYDLRQRLTSRSVGAEMTTFSYWPTGLLKRTTLPDGSYLEYTYDAAHRLIGINDVEGNRIEYTLDAMGNRTAEKVYDPSNTEVRKHTREFNALNRLYKEIAAANTANVTTTYGYDNNGNQTSIAAPLSRNTAQGYDELNRLTSITDPLNGVTGYGYNALDQLTSVTDPKGLVTSYSYNALGDLLQQTSPDTGVTANTYDLAGNLATRTDARGASVGLGTYTYDALNRVTQIGYPDHTVTYEYDSCLNGIGHLCEMTDASGSSAYEYDEQGRVTRKTQTVTLAPGNGTQTREVRYAYEEGRLVHLRMPGGGYVHYSYDTVGRIVAVGLSRTENSVEQPLLSNVLYDPFGGIRGWTWANGTQAIREYDQDGRITIVDSAGSAQFSYDDANRITDVTTDGSAPSWAYGYDQLDRLTGATRTGLTRGYTYDANGNRRTQSGTQSSTYSYSNPLTSNRLAGVTGSLSRTYTYDAAGNVTDDGLMTFTYDGAGRMKSAGYRQYSHNGLGERVYKQDWPGNEVVFVYDEAGHVIEKCVVWVSGVCNEWNSQQIVWLGDIPVAAILETAIYHDEGHILNKYLEVFNIHTDHLNTPRSLTRSNSSNERVWRWNSDPFGIGAADGNVAGGEHFYEFDLRLPGQVFDAESGLHYNYYRDYDPATGRYMQSDPIGLEGGVNTYSYAQSSPVVNVDPTGLFVGPPPPTVAGNAVGAAWAIGTVAGTVIYHAFSDQIQDGLERAFPYERSWREKRGRWKVYVRCNVTAFGSGCECPPPATIGGWAYGNTFGQAFANAQHDANANLGDLGKRNCYPRHCQPVACFENNRPVPCPKSGR